MPSPSRSGAFQVDVDKAVEKFTESISFDYRLAQQDIAGSIAHANMLANQQIITAADAKQIIETLTTIGQEIEQEKFAFRQDLEDIHMNIENALIERIGDVGRKLHTARSRNDQVATDQRIWIREQIDQLDAILKQNQIVLVAFAERESATVIPAYTHLQRAQPVLASHYLLAFCEKFQRDRERLQDCRKRVNLCSLGTAALAGTTLPIDRNATAKALGFDGIVRNSLDSSSDRDYAIEFVFCLSLIAIHLSRIAEDFIIWSSTEFDFIELPEQYCTGSSIMPQKINPDVMELIRGKSARVIGSLQTLLVLTKGLPMAYNRDLQEDKPALFDAVDTVAASLELMRGVIEGSKLKQDSISDGLDQGYLDATTLMEFLIKGGMPQRKAHHLIGQIVRKAMTENVSLAELPLAAYQEFEPSLDDSVFEVLGVSNAIDAFTSEGSTAPERVAAELKRWKQVLGET